MVSRRDAIRRGLGYLANGLLATSLVPIVDDLVFTNKCSRRKYFSEFGGYGIPVDLHTHPRSSFNRYSQYNVLHHLTHGIVALNAKQSKTGILTTDDLLAMPNNRLFRIDVMDDGHTVRIAYNNRIGYALRSQEISSILKDTIYDIGAVGLTEYIDDGLTPQETCKRIHDQGALALLYHPGLVEQINKHEFHFPSAAEQDVLHELAEFYVDGISVHNAQFVWFPEVFSHALSQFSTLRSANDFAVEFAQSHSDVPTFACTDAHWAFDVLHVSATYIPEPTTDSFMIDDLRRHFEENRLVAEPGKISHIDFAYAYAPDVIPFTKSIFRS